MTKKQNEELRKEWERRIALFKASSMKQTKWCKANDLSIHQFKYWLKRLNSPTEVQGTEPNPKWIPVSINDESNNNIDDSLHVKIGQASIEVKPDFNPTLLADVVKVLQSLC